MDPAPVSAMRWDGRVLELLDQRLLPREERWICCPDAASVIVAIRDMAVRGAPAIGAAAAYALAIEEVAGRNPDEVAPRLKRARPTAVNLAAAVDTVLRAAPGGRREAAEAWVQAEVTACDRLAAWGAGLLPLNATVFHHCNTGALATPGVGTARGIVRAVHRAGRRIHVYVGETRPWLQGARLTAWELHREGIPCTLLVDGAAATVLAGCDAVLVGCDRVAANGDVANKVGTLGLAILARHFGVPVLVAMPRSTLDEGCPDGAAIEVERRGDEEVRAVGGVRVAPEVPVHNPAFDVTPAALIGAWVTEDGLWWPPGHRPRVGELDGVG